MRQSLTIFRGSSFDKRPISEDQDRPSSVKGTADIKMAAIVPEGDGSSDVAAFPTADITQGGHDLADEGMQAFGTAVRIS